MPSIILLHGAIGAKDQFHELVKELENVNFEVHCLNFSGHGKEAFERNFGIHQFSNELEEYILTNNLVTPHLFGYSMGGYVALYLASRQAQILGTIFTLGTKFRWSHESALAETKLLDPTTIQTKVPKFAQILRERHGDKWETLLQKTSDMMLQLGAVQLLTSEIICTIPNKVLIGLADKDNMVSLEETLEAYQQLSSGALYILPNSKHAIETINSSLLAKLIESSVKKINF